MMPHGYDSGVFLLFCSSYEMDDRRARARTEQMVKEDCALDCFYYYFFYLLSTLFVDAKRDPNFEHKVYILLCTSVPHTTTRTTSNASYDHNYILLHLESHCTSATPL